MNTADMISGIAAKRVQMSDAAAAKKLAEQEKRNALIAQVRGLKDRIADLIAVGNALRDNGFLYLDRFDRKDTRLEKYGYRGAVVADGIYHDTGFMAGYGCRNADAIKWLGIRMGGACGSFDFYTDGVTVKSVHEDDGKRTQDVPVSHLEQFLREFPAFEHAVYAWVNAELMPNGERNGA